MVTNLFVIVLATIEGLNQKPNVSTLNPSKIDIMAHNTPPMTSGLETAIYRRCRNLKQSLFTQSPMNQILKEPAQIRV